MQGKKAEGRLAPMKALHGAIKFALQLLGLDAEDSGSLLRNLRTAALCRSAKCTAQGSPQSWLDW